MTEPTKKLGVSSVYGPEQWQLEDLGRRAWRVRHCAHLHGKTAVGAALVSTMGDVHVGCNVEHRFRSHCVHAEVNALTSMVANGDGGFAAVIVIAAERDNFTPCGSCLDWIFELGGPQCLVGFQGKPEGPIQMRRADELMPFYPS